MTFVTQILILLFMTCVWNVEGNVLVKRRLNTLETRVNSIEMRIDKDIEALNTSIIILDEQACVCSNVRDENDGRMKQNLGQSVIVPHQSETLMKRGFVDEKKWLRKKVEIFENEIRKAVYQVENNNDAIAETVTRMQVKENDLDRQLNEAISEVMTNCSAEIRKRDEKMEEQQVEIDNLKQMINEMKKVSEDLLVTCPDGWTEFQSFCYLYVKEKKTYVSARETCLKLGASVADIQSSSENDFVYKLCEEKGHSWTNGNVWIGLTDEETEGVWISDRTREKSTYMNWRPDQPDPPRFSQDCLIMGFKAPFDQWNDLECNLTNLPAQFVCKKEL